MNKPTIIITGANGFIGACLVEHFNAISWKVRALVHHFPKRKLPGVKYIQYNIEEKPDERNFAAVDFIVHCAYLRFEQNRNADSININGTKALIELCRERNIKLVFLSSFSAHEKAESHYGKTKFASEKLFDISQDLILKAGFVIGENGLFGAMRNQMKRSFFFPLVGGGFQPLQCIYIDDLASIIESALSNKIFGLYHVAESDVVSLKDFYVEMGKQLNKKIRFVPVPIPLLYAVCKFCEAFRIKIPLSSENVLGLKKMIVFDTKDDLRKLGITLKKCTNLNLIATDGGYDHGIPPSKER